MFLVNPNGYVFKIDHSAIDRMGSISRCLVFKDRDVALFSYASFHGMEDAEPDELPEPYEIRANPNEPDSLICVDDRGIAEPIPNDPAQWVVEYVE